MIKKYYENEVFIIKDNDEELFERAKEQSSDIYDLIEGLEFLRVDFIIESDLKGVITNYLKELKKQ